MAGLDDLFEKKKDDTPILDLSKSTVNSKEEFKRLFDRVPDFKTRPEKARREDIKIREKDFNFKTTKKEIKHLKEPYTMADPVPSEMRSLKVEDLAPVPIDWKMLTNLRPKSKLDDEYFNRLVELGKTQLRTVAREKRESTLNPIVRKTKNKAGIVETRVVSCLECGEEFCNGKSCGDFAYESFTRVTVAAPQVIATKKGASAAAMAALSTGGAKPRRGRKKKKGFTKRSSRSKSRSKSRGAQKTSTRSKSRQRSKSEGRKVKSKKKTKGGSKSDGEM